MQLLVSFLNWIAMKLFAWLLTRSSRWTLSLTASNIVLVSFTGGLSVQAGQPPLTTAAVPAFYGGVTAMQYDRCVKAGLAESIGRPAKEIFEHYLFASESADFSKLPFERQYDIKIAFTGYRIGWNSAQKMVESQPESEFTERRCADITAQLHRMKSSFGVK